MRKDIAIYETDVQRDFSLRDGALFVRANKPRTHLPYGAEEKLPNIYAIHGKANVESWRVLGSVDRHFYEDAELIRNKGGIFEDHCMNGTEGQLRLPALEPQKDVYIQSKEGPMMEVRNYTPIQLRKFVDSNAQIIFEKQSYNVATNPNFDMTMQLLLRDGLKKVVVDGFATDYCVLAAVNALADFNKIYTNKPLQIYVVTDAIEEVDIDFQGKVDPDFGKKALEQMVQAGVKLVTTKDVLEGRLN